MSLTPHEPTMNWTVKGRGLTEAIIRAFKRQYWS